MSAEIGASIPTWIEILTQSFADGKGVYCYPLRFGVGRAGMYETSFYVLDRETDEKWRLRPGNVWLEAAGG